MVILNWYPDDLVQTILAEMNYLRIEEVQRSKPIDLPHWSNTQLMKSRAKATRGCVTLPLWHANSCQD